MKPCYRVVRKFFPLDKNYLLEEAQLRLRDALLLDLIERAKHWYETCNNPLGLRDSFSEKVASYKAQNLQPLYSFYETLAGIYRYKFGETQLGFLWDGKDHVEKYGDDWTEAFQAWTLQLCYQSQFVQAVLDLTVFLPDNPQAPLTESRMNAVMLNLFELRILKNKGIVPLQSAQA